MTEQDIATLEEVLQCLLSAAYYNRAQGRTCFAHGQQTRADALKNVIDRLREEM